MSLLDTKPQVHIISTSPLDTDKGPTDYNAETETYKNYQNSKSEDKTDFEHRYCKKIARNKKLYSLAIKMYNILKEIGIMCFLALTYAALTNDPPKISKSPAAGPFFPKSSIIQDWYRGELGAALTKSKQSDIAFIMFYAPWDAESQAVRHEFELAARYMQKEVTFLAVNCWQPGSECRNQYTKAFNWPILIAYPSRRKGIHYRGIHTAPYMIKFLISLIRPLIRIQDESEIDGLLALNDAVVLGCINALPGSSDYSALYNAALNILENDPIREVPFVVLTGFNNTCINRNNGRVLMLHLWNETLLYPHDEPWKSDAIRSWIQNNSHQVCGWAVPSGSKSFLLSAYIQAVPTLLLFTPRNPLEASQDYYNLLREVALEYSDCEDNERVNLNSALVHTLRLENYLKHKEDLKACEFSPKTDEQQRSFPSVVTYTIPKKWTNNSCCLSNTENPKDSCDKCDSAEVIKDRFPTACKQDCAEPYQHQYLPNSNIYKSCETASEKNLKNSSDAKFNIKSSQKLLQDEKCSRIRFVEKVFPSIFSETITDTIDLKKNINVSRCNGLVCKANVTLLFIALDSLRHHHFAERLGIDLSVMKDRTAAVIVDEKMETHHILQESVNDETLRQFVINYTNGNLPRAFSTAADFKSKFTHVYSPKKSCNIKDSSQFCLTELDSETFLPTVLQQDQVVVVLYYSKQCSFCSGVSYAFLTVAKMFFPHSFIKFVRIDGDLNSLPWEFTMERYPTILYFPFRRKAESRVFPQNMPVNVSNLLSFLLANLNQTLKLHAMWILCNQNKVEEDRQLCISSTRTENWSLIDRTLRAWRNADVLRKAKLLYKLQQLRNINLLLALHPQNSDDLDKYLSQLHWSSNEEVSVSAVNNKNKSIKDEL